MIFGNWRPGGLAVGAGLFGYTDVTQLRQGGTSVHALFLTIAIALALLGVYLLVRRAGRILATACLLLAAGALAVYLLTDTIASQFVAATPYVTTLLVLGLASQRLRMPAADGQIYRKGTAT
jgi:simple sugar transport system permease protein